MFEQAGRRLLQLFKVSELDQHLLDIDPNLSEDRVEDRIVVSQVRAALAELSDKRHVLTALVVNILIHVLRLQLSVGFLL